LLWTMHGTTLDDKWSIDDRWGGSGRGYGTVVGLLRWRVIASYGYEIQQLGVEDQVGHLDCFGTQFSLACQRRSAIK